MLKNALYKLVRKLEEFNEEYLEVLILEKLSNQFRIHNLYSHFNFDLHNLNE